MRGSRLIVLVALLAAPGAGTASAVDFGSQGDGHDIVSNSGFVLRGSFGVAAIAAREKVFAFPEGDEMISLLDWRSTAPIASIDAKARFHGNWTLRGRIDAAVGGNSAMTDYDWLGGSYAFDDWTHRSLHPGTSLDWYFSGEIALGGDVAVTDRFVVNVNGGLKYTDVKWTAVGGTYIYSTGGGFRNETGSFPDVPGIDYRMRLPTAFLGLDGVVSVGPWTLAAGGRIGGTPFANATDNHYARTPPLRFEDGPNWAFAWSAEARATYAFNERLGVFLEAGYEKTVSSHGPVSIYDATTGTQLFQSNFSSGMELEVASLRAGAKGTF